jgi:sec-independent protein translocase protein TatB
MFNMGISEMAIIAGLALILIGPKQLPEVARTLGRLLNELRRSTSSFTDDLKKQVQIDHNLLDPNTRPRAKVNQDPPPAADENKSDEKKS